VELAHLPLAIDEDRRREGEHAIELGQLAGGIVLVGDAGDQGGVVDVVAAAETVRGLGGLLGGLAGAIGGNAALISTIVGGFGKLGLNAEDAKRFAPVMSDYLKTKISPEAVSKLEQTLRA
jgi:hypothetical protein